MLPDTLCVDSMFGSTEETQDCGTCYHISMAVVIGIVVCDILLTIIIIISVICFVKSYSNRQRELRDERTVPSPESKEVTESPYQELQGTQSDVYSELNHFR
ncbi:TYRO protein tyrosine kinase-binding protein [Periophthalmus magnuspinnatus]|uniref:TYRO protein tyrosine kinase-binding protein n=1 Tax=Periophthalmus magnuspinnatus TaxID=409849 RepID=UPI00145B7445|nr:TYRO protein tyrosine kinase-binding protein [Periophthalmus magnuspinnatus]